MPIETLVPREVTGMERNSATSEIRRRTDNHETQVAGHRHGDHVLFDDLAKLDAGVVAVRDDVHRCIAHDQVELDLRMCREKPGEQRLAEQGFRSPR